MVASEIPRAFNIRRHLPPQHSWPVLWLLTISFGCMFLLLYASTRSQDAAHLEREAETLKGAIQNATNMATRDLQDYARWDDAIRHTADGVDNEWINDNIVSYLGRIQDYSHLYILDEQDRPAFGFGPQPSNGSPQALLGDAFADSIPAIRKMPISSGPIVSGFSRSGTRIYIYSTAAIVPLTDKVKIRPGPTKLLVIARQVDASMLASTPTESGTQKPHLHLNRGSGPAVALKDLNGHPIAWVEWVPHRPGSMLLRQLVPMLAVLAIFAILVAGLIVRRGSLTIEALQQSELRARHYAFHDLLTCLPNRRALVEKLSSHLADDTPLHLLYMDLDGFKDANDVYGHPAGDLLLREAAARIQAAVPGSFVARAGGDEFAVVVDAASREDADIACEAILQRFRTPFEIGAYRITLGVSVGCAEFTRQRAGDEDEVMRRADIAMYAAKSEGKNRACHYNPSLDDGHVMRMRLERALQEAVTDGDIYVSYQPIVHADTLRPASFEALARWDHPEHGKVPPDVFIPIAEMNGLISAIGKQMLMQACKAMRNVDASLAINLSPAQFWDRNLIEDVKEVLQVTGFPPERLELEITEALMIRQPERAADIIERLRDMGIKIALDDFGTGFASIGYLQRLNLDRIKIDKAFIAPLEHDPRSREMLMSIVALAHAFDLEVCSEGVETEAQLEIAVAAGCTRLQGWLLGRPMTPDELQSWMDQQSGRIPAAA